MSSSLKYKIIIPYLMLAWLFIAPAQLVLAADTGAEKAIGGLEATAKKGGVQSKTTDLPTIIGQVIGAILAFVGVIFFALILWSGMGWMLAKGNEEQINKSKETIFGAVLGLMVILGAYAITKLVADIFSKL